MLLVLLLALHVGAALKHHFVLRDDVWRGCCPDTEAGALEAKLEAQAYWSVASGVGEMRDERLRAPAEDEVQVRALWSGVSRGTEALVALGPRATQPMGVDASSVPGRASSRSR